MLTSKLHSGLLKAKVARSIRFMQRAVPSCSRNCSTLTTSWRRPLTTTSCACQLEYEQRRCTSAWPCGDSGDYSGKNLSNITEVVSKQSHSHAYEYEEDYDEDNLHMTPNSVASQDREQLAELEMIRPEDLTLQYDSDLQSGVAEIGNSKYHDDDENAYDSSQDDYVELEEDREIMHKQQTGLNVTMDEVLDNVDGTH